MIKLKIFKTAEPAVGETISGFVIDSEEAPFNSGSFHETPSIDEVKANDAATVYELLAGGEIYELERVDRAKWMSLMARLENFREAQEGRQSRF